MSPEAEIRRRIRERGRITFAEFMDLALYWPGGGYYLGREPIGPTGDYYTSPLVHPAFGALLSVHLFQLWQLLDRPDPFSVVEPGAGNGLLCRDLLSYSAHLPLEFGRALRYLCLDRRQAPGTERDLPAGAGAPRAARIAAAGLPLRGIRGCILSNEYLDSFPVHQVTVRRGSLQEVYVTLNGKTLAAEAADPSTPALAARLEGLGIALAEGQTAEINLGLDSWAKEAESALEAGLVLTIDYGHPALELYSPERRHRGTLTTYYRHIQTDAPFRHIGRQDMTAQVDFTSMASAGRRAGLPVIGLARQRDFLNCLGLRSFQERLTSLRLSPRVLEANRAGVLDLVRPGGLGDFVVLAQGKNLGQPELWGFGPSPEALALAEELPVPLLTPDHLSLIEGKYPLAESDFEALWPFSKGRSGEPPGRSEFQ